MNRLSRPLMIVLSALWLGLAGCSDGDGSNCATPEQERLIARQTWAAAVDDAQACTSNADCGIYTKEVMCITSSCGTALNKSEFGQLTELAADLKDRIDRCDGGPCPVATCLPLSCPQTAVCVESKCQIAECPPTVR